MKELFIEEREINRDIDKHLDDEYHYNKWKKEMDEENPDFITKYRSKYMKAREDAGIPDDDESFIKYLGEDVDLGF